MNDNKNQSGAPDSGVKNPLDGNPPLSLAQMTLLSNQTAIRVFVRARPPPEGLILNNIQDITNDANDSILDEENAAVFVPSVTINSGSRFQFTGVLGTFADQKRVYSTIAIHSMIQTELLSGVNCCIIAYGATKYYSFIV